MENWTVELTAGEKRLTIMKIQRGIFQGDAQEEEEEEEENLNHSDQNIIKIGWETLKSPSDLKRLVATLTSLKVHQLTRVWKTRQE